MSHGCTHTLDSGRNCHAPALTNSPLCRHHDPRKRAEASKFIHGLQLASRAIGDIEQQTDPAANRTDRYVGLTTLTGSIK